MRYAVDGDYNDLEIIMTMIVMLRMMVVIIKTIIKTLIGKVECRKLV